MNIPKDITRCLGNHCKFKMKQKCRRWIGNEKEKETFSVADFHPEKTKKEWKCDFKIEKEKI
ncbi:hypothetical protein ACFFUE_07140 [Bergeyella porcorum]|uniref:hypothetical protein n=1 Tax=Bergeyella porcorum TaxID=1735111 RepID=UPI0035EDB519